MSRTEAFAIDKSSPPSFAIDGTILFMPGIRLAGTRAISRDDLLP